MARTGVPPELRVAVPRKNRPRPNQADRGRCADGIRAVSSGAHGFFASCASQSVLEGGSDAHVSTSNQTSRELDDDYAAARSSSRRTVSMVRAAHTWQRDHLCGRRRSLLDWSRLGSILAEGEVAAIFVVVAHVVAKQVPHV